MINLDKSLKLLEKFSVITTGDDKRSNFKWELQQKKKLTEEQFIECANFKGSTYLDKDNREIERKASTEIAIVTGFEDLEVVDVDLKVLSIPKDRKEFWEEYIKQLDDNIVDFYNKVAIYKTKNDGYHILYKSKSVEGNRKLAKLEGNKEAIIETRGKYGYVIVYTENKVSKLSYLDIDYIEDEDRNIIINVSRSYNYVDPKEAIVPTKKGARIENNGVNTWEDFNSKKDIFDIVGDEFEIVANTSKHYCIKRHGASSAHSGYIYKDKGFMYLFSTGTIYPAEKLITPFIAYAYKYHNGDMGKTASDLYKQGFGTRLKPILPEPKEPLKVIDIEQKNEMSFPIDVFPAPFQNYILECNRTLDANIDFMGVSLLWLVSVCVGNNFKLEVKKGRWSENLSVWLSVVGVAGLGKTPSMENILFPLKKINNARMKDYFAKQEQFVAYEKLSKTEQKDVRVIEKPIKTQVIVNDVTIESLVDILDDKYQGVGLFMDEQSAWIKNMNRYKEGSDKEFWLSTWSGQEVTVNRMSRKGSFVPNPFVSVLGGIQPNILNNFFTDENSSSGFLDRILFCFPTAKVEEYNEEEIDEDLVQWYSDSIAFLFDNVNNVAKFDDFGNLKPFMCKFSEDGKKEWIRVFNEYTDIQNSDNESEFYKSMYPKQKSYIPRFSALLHILDHFFPTTDEQTNILEVSEKSVLGAEKLSKYFVNNAKNIKTDTSENNKVKNIIYRSKSLDGVERLKDIIKNSGGKINKKAVAEQLSVSRKTLDNWIKSIESV